MAIPCTYLQRHTLELVLKSLLNVAYGIAADQQSIDATKTSGHPTWIESQKVEHTHPLVDLVEELAPALKAIGYECPPALAELAHEMSALENKQPSRLRYPTVGQKKNEVASFPEEVTIPVLQWQEQLDSIEREVLSMRSGDWTGTLALVEELYLETQGQAQTMRALSLL